MALLTLYLSLVSPVYQTYLVIITLCMLQQSCSFLVVITPARFLLPRTSSGEHSTAGGIKYCPLVVQAEITCQNIR